MKYLQRRILPVLLLLTRTIDASANQGPYALLERFADVLVYVEEAYVDPVDRNRLIEGATAGMVSELDPHSAYLTPAQFAQFLEDTQGEFAGLGVEVDFRDDRVTVITTMPGSPAESAGILPGDSIIGVDSISLAGVRAEAVVRHMRGPAGTKIRLKLRRDGFPNPIQVTLTRAVVIVPSVEGKLLDHGVAYIRLKSFQEGSYVELVEQIARLSKNASVTGIVLDMRGNPGGLVTEAVAIADEFLDKGTIYSARHRGKVVETVVSHSGDLLELLPLVVLVGAGTASSAEIVSGALQDRGRATIVGEPTFGKGSVQNVIELPGGAGLLLTTLRYFTPSGHAIQARGLIPEVLVKSADSGPTIREADIAGHLHTEDLQPPSPGRARQRDGAAPEVSTTPPAPADSASPIVTGTSSVRDRAETPVGADAHRDKSAKDGEASEPPRAPLHERKPIAAIPLDPTGGTDPVLAKGYALLRSKLPR